MASSSRKVIYAALIGNSLIAVTKFIAGGITGSSAMLSEGIHSVVDTGNQVLLLLGLRRAQQPADAMHPFGYGKEVYFWSFIVAILIFAVGAGVSMYEGILHLMHPTPVTNPMVNYVVLGLAMVFEGAAWWMALKAFNKARGETGVVRAVQRAKDPSLFVVLFEDSAALLGLVVAFVGILLGQVTGIPYFDGAASVVIGLILAGTAVWLAFESKGLLIGEAASPAIINGVRDTVAAMPGVVGVNEVLTLHMGPDFILVTVSADFDDDIEARQVEATTVELDRSIKAAWPQVARVFVEAAPRGAVLDA